MIDNLYYKTRGELEALIRAMAWNDAMGCHTRGGFEKWIWPEIYARARYIVYFDVNGVHEINQAHGTYTAFDAMMKQVLSTVRSTDIVSCQYLSGDEFLICLTETPDRKIADPEGLVERLTQELAKHQLTAMFAIEEVRSPILTEIVRPAEEKVFQLKAQRGVSR